MTTMPDEITGGVDTHLDVHVAAALNAIGGLLGVESFPADGPGYRQLLVWLQSFGTVVLVGVEGTGSYGAGLTRHLHDKGMRVVEVDRPNRQERRRAGKSDPLDAVEAARAALSGRAKGLAKTRNGSVEAIRVLRVARSQCPQGPRPGPQPAARSLISTAPEELRAELRGLDHLQAGAQDGRSAARSAAPTSSTPTSWPCARLARRVRAIDAEVAEIDAVLNPLVAETAPDLVALYGVGPDTAGALVVAAGDNPERLRNEATFAHLCGVSPLDASSGKQLRHRLNRERGPPGQLRPVAHRRDSDGVGPENAALRRAPVQGGPHQGRGDALPEALRRPRSLLLPRPATRLLDNPRSIVR